MSLPEPQTPQSLTQKKFSLLERTYLPGVFKGLMVVLKHLFGLGGKKTVTIQYPEQEAPRFERTRGLHYMKTDDQGRANCVACFMCSTACPADAIQIESQVAPWEDRDTYPSKFVINQLRCIYCGFCEEACPKDAIHLSQVHAPVYTDRASAIHDLEGLMDKYPKFKEQGLL